jgi:vacuolar-type H+-ATPase subunit H
MSSYSDRDVYSQTGSWLLGTVRRNPEALLLMAAGCCLMMRSRSSSRTSVGPVYERDEWGYPTRRAFSQVRGASESAREGLSRATDAASDTARSAGEYASQAKDRITDTASDYASQMKERISDTASDYADSVRDFAGEARRAVTQRSARLSRQTQATLQSSMQRVLREQPLAVAVAGLATGAAVAALFPSTEIEDRALGGAHEQLKGAAEKAGERVMEAAGKAGERLKSAAKERGLTSEGLKEAAGEVAGTFKDAISGKPENRSDASQAGGSAASGSGQSSGMEQNRQGSPGSGTTQPNPGGRSMR